MEQPHDPIPERQMNMIRLALSISDLVRQMMSESEVELQEEVEAVMP